MQERRYTEYTGIYCNAQMNSKLLAMYAQPDAKGLALLKMQWNDSIYLPEPTTGF